MVKYVQKKLNYVTVKETEVIIINIFKKIIISILTVMLIFSVINLPVSAARVTHLNTSKTVITLGDTYKLKLYTKNNNPINNKRIVWKSSNTKIAKVDKNGKVSAVRKGNATVKAKFQGKTYKCTVNIKPAKLNFTKKTLYKGKKATLALNSPLNKKISASKIKWTTSDNNVASVSKSGKITAKSSGKATVTAKYLGKKYSCVITVKTKAVTKNYSSNSDKVWIPTNGGTKYHSSSTCSNMLNPLYVTKSQAISQGFTACKRCY